VSNSFDTFQPWILQISTNVCIIDVVLVIPINDPSNKSIRTQQNKYNTTYQHTPSTQDLQYNTDKAKSPTNSKPCKPMLKELKKKASS